MFRTLSPGDSISAPRRQEGKSGYIQVCNKGSRQSEHQRPGIKLRNLIFCVWEDASLWAHCTHFPHMHFSYLRPNPVSLFTLLPAFPQLLSNHCGWWQHLLDHSLGRSHSPLETRNRWWPWHFLLINMAGDIFISHCGAAELFDVFWLVDI